MQPAISPPPADHADAGLGVEALLRGTWDLVRKHPLPLLLPLTLLGLLSAGGSGKNAAERSLDPGSFGDPRMFLPFFALLGFAAIVLLALLLFLHVVAHLVTARAALTALEQAREPDIGTAFQETKGLILGATGTALLWLVIVIVGFILLIVPGILFIAFLLPVMAVIVAERLTGMDAIKRAWTLTEGHRVALTVVVVIAIFASLVADVVLGVLPLLGGALAGAASGAIGAMLATAGALFYARRTKDHRPVPSPAVLSTVDGNA